MTDLQTSAYVPVATRPQAVEAQSDTILDVRDLKTYFFLRRGIVKAVDGVSFSLRRGEVLGLVGESGCGKSLTALSVMRLLPKGGAKTVGGQVLLNGDDILKRPPRGADRRRADNRARCDDPVAIPKTAEASAAGNRNGNPVHHA